MVFTYKQRGERHLAVGFHFQCLRVDVEKHKEVAVGVGNVNRVDNQVITPLFSEAVPMVTFIEVAAEAVRSVTPHRAPMQNIFFIITCS